MNKTTRGLLVFIGLVVFIGFFCVALPFAIMPGAGVGVALPAIFVPGEVLVPDFLGEGFDLTNTLVGMLLTDVVLLLIVLFIAIGGGVKMIPGRLQAFVELFVEYMYNFARSVAGSNAKRIFPLVMTIFFFLLFANWLELVPGVDSVGLLHCAPPGINGYPSVDGVTLSVTSPLDAGEPAEMEGFCACELEHYGHIPAAYEAECAGLGFAPVEHEEGDHEEEAAPEGETPAVEGEESTVPEGESGTALVTDTAAGEGEGLAHEGEEHEILYVVTPFVRAAATDLNLTIAFGIISVIMIQVYGVWALGPDYFQKFFNLRALGNLGKKPLGLIDFLVGLIEIVSEVAKIISFAFRLFGNIFAGQVLLFIMMFLVATMLPVVFYALELFVGLMQAFVFAVLTLIFAAQAMAGHHGDDDH
ncbi:MAG: F0F1 ATP synthase subunit A [Anaerolineae bacterium]|nr:F0F1 ATP synthase subunit A [Anaerolineae bacterium]